LSQTPGIDAMIFASDRCAAPCALEIELCNVECERESLLIPLAEQRAQQRPERPGPWDVDRLQ
jgi:hypothetical protein